MRKTYKVKGLLLAVVIVLSAIVSGCKGDYTISDAVVVSKPIPPAYRSMGVITVEKDGNQYSFRVYDADYRVAEVGARVDIEYRNASERARIKPVSDVLDSGEAE